MVTVGQLIESLKNHPLDAPVEIAIKQYNKVYPVVYVPPDKQGTFIKTDIPFFASCMNGTDVRIMVSLPQTDETYMVTKTIKK